MTQATRNYTTWNNPCFSSVTPTNSKTCFPSSSTQSTPQNPNLSMIKSSKSNNSHKMKSTSNKSSTRNLSAPSVSPQKESISGGSRSMTSLKTSPNGAQSAPEETKNIWPYTKKTHLPQKAHGLAMSFFKTAANEPNKDTQRM